LCDSNEIGLKGLEEPDQRSEDHRVPRTLPQLFRLDSGQVEEPLRPSLVGERCSKRGQRKRQRVIVCCALQRLRQP